MDENREYWNSRTGFILATVGSAIGLGNIWRFPTAVGQNGGGAFLFLYLIIILIIGLPLMIGELTIGRKGTTNIVHTFKRIKPDTGWWAIGGLGVLTGFIILSFYSVIAGWSLNYILKFFAGEFAGLPPGEMETIYHNFVGSPIQPLFWQGLFIIITAVIVAYGIDSGIEKASKILMPVMFVLLFLLTFRSVTLEGAWEGIRWYLKPNFKVMNINIILGALGQVFFSLSLGMGAIITYGSYLKDEENIPESGFIISLADLTIAIIAGLIIIPAVFAFGLEPEIGPPLIFITLPLVFGSIPLGNIFGGLFFTLLTIAAITSSISILEVIVAYINDKFQWTRKKSSITAGIIIFFLGIPSSLSRGVFAHILILNLPILDFMDYIASNLLLPLAGLLTALFIGWSWKPDQALVEINKENNYFKLHKLWTIIIKYILPVVMGYILISGLIF